MALFIVAAAGLAGWATTRPQVPLLIPRSPARWIVFPLKPVDSPRMYIDLPARFRHAFNVDALPAKATLRIRAMRRFRIDLNGQRVGETDPNDNWKSVRPFDVSALLRPGDNRIEVQVANDLGPSALWLALQSPDGRVLAATRDTWQVSCAGSVWVDARDAADFPSGAELWPPVARAPPGAALGVIVVIGAVLALVAVAVVRSWDHPRLFIAVTVTVWVALFANNAGVLHPVIGYDAEPHLAYVQYLLDHHRLPQADEGFEMNQPPLYYAVSAAALGVCGLDTLDPGAAYVLRAIGLIAGVATVLLVYAALGRIFPDDPRRAAMGWLLAAALPVHLYLHQYITNEWLMATFVTAAIYLTLRIITERACSWRMSIGLGACLGAALLTKMTALIPMGVMWLALAWAFAGQRRDYMRVLAAPVLIALALAGWHYARTWAHTGSPFITANDPTSSYIWWQDPGYATPGFYLQFGRVLVEPFYVGFTSYPDGFYSTLFGDAMFGSKPPDVAPAWNLHVMSACYALSLLPMAALLIGTVLCAARFCRKPDPITAMLLLLPALMLAAMVMFSLRIANYGCSKVFYGLSAVIPCCALAAWGLDWLMRRGRAARFVTGVWLAAWALGAVASFWIVRGSDQTAVSRAAALVQVKQIRDAVPWLDRAIAVTPDHRTARTAMTTLLGQSNRPDDAAQHVNVLLHAYPADADVQWIAGWLADRRGRGDEAIAHARRALELAPDHPKAQLLLAELLERAGQTDEAIDAYRRTLLRNPDDRHTHFALARLYAATGQSRPASFHQRYADEMERRIGYFPWSR